MHAREEKPLFLLSDSDRMLNYTKPTHPTQKLEYSEQLKGEGPPVSLCRHNGGLGIEKYLE
jgi:hypothetical protein